MTDVPGENRFGSHSFGRFQNEGVVELPTDQVGFSGLLKGFQGGAFVQGHDRQAFLDFLNKNKRIRWGYRGTNGESSQNGINFSQGVGGAGAGGFCGQSEGLEARRVVGMVSPKSRH